MSNVRESGAAQKMVHESGAHSTDVEEAEPVEHLCGKCMEYACQWKETADKLWAEHPYQQKGLHPTLRKIRGDRYQQGEKTDLKMGIGTCHHRNHCFIHSGIQQDRS